MAGLIWLWNQGTGTPVAPAAAIVTGGWLPPREWSREDRRRRTRDERRKAKLRETLALAYGAVFGEVPPLLADGDALPATRAALADTSASPVATLPAVSAVDWGDLGATVAQLSAAIAELAAVSAAVEEDEADVEMLIFGSG